MTCTVTIAARGQLRVAEAVDVLGSRLPKFGTILDVNASSRFGHGFGGFDTCEVRIKPNGAWVGGLFRPGDYMEINGSTYFSGEYIETTYEGDGEAVLHGRGFAHDMFAYPCIKFDPVGGGTDTYFPTRNFADGLDYAVNHLGMAILAESGTAPTALAGSADGTVSINEYDDPPRFLGDVLTDIVSAADKYWALWGRTLWIGDQSTDVRWLLDSTEGLSSVADPNYVTHVFVTFNKTGGGTGMGRAVDIPGLDLLDARCALPVDYRAVILDGSNALRQIKADAIALNLLNQVKGRFTLAGTVSVTPESGLRSAGGGRATLGFVRAGNKVQLVDHRTSQGNLMPGAESSFIVGEAKYSWTPEGESLSLTPMDPAPRNLSQILATPPSSGGAPIAP